MANGKRTRSSGQAKAYTTRVFEQFYKVAAQRLEAVQDGLSEAEIPSPPDKRKRGTPVPPIVSTPKFGEMK
jgi:hypothetical protein|tara:strand:+ start:349 stop:561 length:213 start_codon:yes stop_codon:yes gene_type:complete